MEEKRLCPFWEKLFRNISCILATVYLTVHWFFKIYFYFLILFSADLLTGLNGWAQTVHKQREEKDSCLSISSPAVVLTACYSQPLRNHHSTLLFFLYRGKAGWKVSLFLLFFSCIGWLKKKTILFIRYKQINSEDFLILQIFLVLYIL